MTRWAGWSLALITGLAVWLTNCTAYRPAGMAGGYSEVQLSGDIFLVSLRWLPFTPPEHIEDFLLLRAAEVTLARGEAYFIVLERNKDLRSESFTGTQATDRSSQPSPGEGTRHTPMVPIYEDTRSASLRIRLVHAPAAAGHAVLNAAELRATLRAKYRLQDDGHDGDAP